MPGSLGKRGDSISSFFPACPIFPKVAQHYPKTYICSCTWSTAVLSSKPAWSKIPFFPTTPASQLLAEEMLSCPSAQSSPLLGFPLWLRGARGSLSAHGQTKLNTAYGKREWKLDQCACCEGTGSLRDALSRGRCSLDLLFTLESPNQHVHATH